MFSMSSSKQLTEDLKRKLIDAYKEGEATKRNQSLPAWNVLCPSVN